MIIFNNLLHLTNNNYLKMILIHDQDYNNQNNYIYHLIIDILLSLEIVTYLLYYEFYCNAQVGNQYWSILPD
jgi:hypothetical protein